MLEIAKDEKTGKRGAFIVAGQDSKIPNPDIVRILYDFVYQCIRTECYKGNGMAYNSVGIPGRI
jgi:hypothetical protein